jgi:hypothetical protein
LALKPVVLVLNKVDIGQGQEVDKLPNFYINLII